MISNGSLQHYLAYAAGEVLLIVIGILITVQLSDLNEQRKSLDLENLASSALLLRFALT